MPKAINQEEPLPPITMEFRKLVERLSICNPDHMKSNSKSRFKNYYGILARWLYGEDTTQNRNYLTSMYRGAIKARPAHVVLMQTMELLEGNGYDLLTLKTDDAGQIVYLENLHDSGLTINRL